MIPFLAVIGGLILTFVLYAYVFFSLFKKNKLELLEWFLLSLGTFNGIGFGLVIWATSQGRNPVDKASLLLQYDVSAVINYLILNVILALSSVFGWYVAKALWPFKGTRIQNLSDEKTLLRSKYYLVAWVTLFLGIASYFLYTLPYGGFVNYLEYSKALRAGIPAVSNSFSFLKPFGGLTFFSSILFFGLAIEKHSPKHKNKRILIGIILSFLFSIYVLYSWEGRFALVTYIGTFVLAYILYFNKSAFVFFKRMILFVTVAFLLVIGSDSILGGTRAKLGVIEFFSKELSFPFISYIAQIYSPEFRWFQDIMVGPLFIFPQKIWSGMFGIETASSFNTYLILGARKGVDSVTGEIPIDILMFGYMQASVLGVVVMGLIFGVSLLFIDRFAQKIPLKGIRYAIYANLIINVPIRSILYGDPQHIINRNFHLILGFIVVGLLVKKNYKKRHI
ncbi:hypothetical protein [Priestia megaterium]|uniref:hypothetical protein n=1 Tax=Priestia megaterium TaxID=1404 RepID=UPI003F7E9CD0